MVNDPQRCCADGALELLQSPVSPASSHPTQSEGSRREISRETADLITARLNASAHIPATNRVGRNTVTVAGIHADQYRVVCERRGTCYTQSQNIMQGLKYNADASDR